jgi:hypothetical protein
MGATCLYMLCVRPQIKKAGGTCFFFAAITETVGYENESQANGSAEPAGDCYVRPWREITIQRNDVAGSGASLERKWQFGRLPWLY